MSLFSELKRRNIFKVAMAYLALGWVVIQITDVLVPALNLPDVLNSIVAYIGIIGFPFALFFAWAFELTPEGMKRTVDVEPEESIRRSTGQKINYIIIALLAVAVMFLVYDRSMVPDTELRANTIAVMPFADMSPDGSQEYFGDGMAEEILNVIVSVDALDVTSRTTSFSLKGQNLSVPEIAERLGVNYILEGSIRRDGDNVRVTAQLIDVAADTHLWSDTYDRELTSIFAIQDEISLAIADALQVELLGDVIGDIPTRNMEAYELVLQASQLTNVPSFENALEMKELANQAIKLDPTFTIAWARLATSYYSLAIFGRYSYSPEELENLKSLALKSANKAITLNPTYANGWDLKGRIHLLDLDMLEAKIALDQTLALDPKNEATQFLLGLYSHAVGDFETSINVFNSLINLRPDSADSHTRLSVSLIANDNIEQARVSNDKAIDLGYGWANYYRALLLMIDGNKNNVVENIRISIEYLSWPAIENLDLLVEGYFDPVLRDDYKKLLTESTMSNNSTIITGSLLLNDGENFVKGVKSEIILKVNYIEFLYLPPYRPMLNQQVVKDYLHEIGLVELWQQTKFPPFCHAVGADDFMCEVD